MSEIAWSKAPEGCTHYVVGSTAPYEKRVGDNWWYWSVEREAWIAMSNIGDQRLAEGLLAIIPRPSPAWSGEGLPPVGVRCEAAIPHTSGPDNERSFIWIEGCVIAYYEIKGKTYAWFSEDDGFYPPNVLEFRPIRTPEQIAADEREAAIKEMLEDAGRPDTAKTRDQAQLLYDAGWRKVERAQ